MKPFLLSAIIFLASVVAATGQPANHLLGTKSPYLLQHLNNPVDWYPWGSEALEKARSENKLIFISVGYSSCHWCHVMEEESFENPAIAALLNSHFVSIKIDKESRPDLDEQFMYVTRILKKSGGWPNSVFLTPEGDPFHAGGYFPPEAFAKTLMQVRRAWADNPNFIISEAAKVSRAVATYMTSKAEAREVTPESVRLASDKVREKLDGFSGGYGIAPKFPREPLFLFLLDQAERAGDQEQMQAVSDMLDGMIKGGIHDHVGGGFHRYSIDPEWHEPHFEKMLYTQALTGRLLTRVWHSTGAPRHRRAAQRLFDYVLRDMRSRQGGFFSAQDADSLTSAGEPAEGGFYTWALTDLEPLKGEADLVRDVFQITPHGDIDDASILHLRELPKDLAIEFDMTSPEFTARLDQALLDMRALRSMRPAPFLDRKIILSWNAIMIETLAEAGYVLERPDYYEAAETAARYLLKQMRSPNGLRRVSYEGTSSIDGQLQDYASLALALIALHDYAPNPSADSRWLREARALADMIRHNFGAAENGYRMTQIRDGLGDIVPVDDAEIPSGNALALTLFARISHRLQAPEIEQDGFRLAAALSGHALKLPQQRGYALKAIQELQHGETGPVRHVAKGAVRAEFRHGRTTGDINIRLSIAEGWHINAHRPLEEYFVATKLSVEPYPEQAVSYPTPRIKTLSFNDAPLALYEGSLQITAKVAPSPDSAAPRQATLILQACSDETCLQPEEMTFTLW